MGDDSKSAGGYVKDASVVIAGERQLLGLPYDAKDTVGLAISGGGIRSASFALGVMQALVNERDKDPESNDKQPDLAVMQHVDYLSTVSGGGYIGSALTWFLKQRQGAGMTEETFPFGQRPKRDANDIAARNDILDYVRQHGAYLTPTGPLGMASFIAVVLRAMAVSLIVYFSLLTAVIWGLAKLSLFWFDKPMPWTLRGVVYEIEIPRPELLAFVPNPLLAIALAFGACFLVASLLFSLSTRVAGAGEYGWRTWVQKAFGFLLRASIATAMLGTLPLIHDELPNWITTAWTSATAGGAALGFVEFVLRQRGGDQSSPSALGTMRPLLAAALVLYGLGLGAYSIALLFMNETWDAAEQVLGVAICSAGIIACFVNINYLGLHRMYRDRLMELFLPNGKTITGQRWALASDADAACVATFCGAPTGAAVRPYHIINTNVVLVDSKTAVYRGRGGDNFIVSPLYCGSDATGFAPSSVYMKRKDSDRGMTLPTAMAISGAAVNPNAGVSGRGTTRTRIVSTLLALLNLRLGYWAPHPKLSAERKRQHVPNFVDPGLRGGVLTGGLHEDGAMIELTDGGHFENLAVYELIRRRVKTIFVCDGGQDGGYTFDDLANLIERVRVDFGAKISFDDKEFGLDKLRPGSAAPSQGAPIADRALAAQGFAIGRIRYQDDPRTAPSGTLIYFKGTMTPGLSVDLYGYKNANPDFPHESTGDQFFDEDQFEAYRELGYHIGWQWLENKGAFAFWKPPQPSTPPASGARAGSDAAVINAAPG